MYKISNMAFVLVNIQIINADAFGDIALKMSLKYKTTLSVAVRIYVRCIVCIAGDAEVREIVMSSCATELSRSN
ncbi:unnamed protein product [Acanthoscelides obtectus]|uniref:Uncharacterized protein n=1 Tax=Acanthoscelides obtectus TaxID=200917 RepID=A0A9P0K0F0_ACAOB|nr:unnamed protein product [Acanthoscelides obtectus]CAK1648700.1 hypothetical protein AOBTE_LOCUS15829 [Acanthoscelides obtectus]